MFCGECGTQNPDTNQFCKNCGRPLRRPQPAATPVQSSSNVPTAAMPSPQPSAAVTQPPPAAAAKPARNWTGIGSLVLGIGSWILFPYLLALFAIVLGAYSLYKTRRATKKIAYLAVAGIVIAVASVVLDYFYLTLFPTHNLPPFP